MGCERARDTEALSDHLLALRSREWRDANEGPGTWFERYAAEVPSTVAADSGEPPRGY